MKSVKYFFVLLIALTLSGCFASAREAGHTMDNVQSSSESGVSSTQSTMEGVDATITKENLDDEIRKGNLLSY